MRTFQVKKNVDEVVEEYKEKYPEEAAQQAPVADEMDDDEQPLQRQKTLKRRFSLWAREKLVSWPKLKSLSRAKTVRRSSSKVESAAPGDTSVDDIEPVPQVRQLDIQPTVRCCFVQFGVDSFCYH